MASQDNQELSAPTTNHQNGEGTPHSARGKSTGKSMGGGGGRGSSKGFGSRNRGNGGGRHKHKDVGRAEWAYVNPTISSSPSGLINQAVPQAIEEHAMTSKLQNDKG